MKRSFYPVPKMEEKLRTEAQNKKISVRQLVFNIIADYYAPAKEQTILELLDENAVPYIDNREKGGTLWVFYDEEIAPLVSYIAGIYHCRFVFTKKGGKATKGKAAWYLYRENGETDGDGHSENCIDEETQGHLANKWQNHAHPQGAQLRTLCPARHTPSLGDTWPAHFSHTLSNKKLVYNVI